MIEIIRDYFMSKKYIKNQYQTGIWKIPKIYNVTYS